MASSNNTASILRPVKFPGVDKKTKDKPVKKVPRQDSPRAKDPLNFTSYRPDQDHWSWNSFPEILYQLKPTEKRNKGLDAPLLTYQIHGEYLRDLPVLPDNIASNVEEFRVEAWMRLDRRIQLRDIKDRMHKDFRVSENTLQQRIGRFRQYMRMASTPRSIQLGVITPGLIDPVLGEAGGRIALPAEYKRHESVDGRVSTSKDGNSLEDSKEGAPQEPVPTQEKRVFARDPVPPLLLAAFRRSESHGRKLRFRRTFADYLSTKCCRDASEAVYTTPPDETHTCDHPHHSPFWEGNLPPLLFRLDPPENREHGIITELEEDGAIVRDQKGASIRYFEFLPRYISNNPPTWLIEYWMRTDARLTYRDIKARMTAPRDQQPTENALNMRREREVRSPLGLSCWAARRGRTSRVARIDLERMESWTYDQVHLNTTMEIEYRFDKKVGQLVPCRLRSKSLTSDSETTAYYPLNHFLNADGAHVPSDRTVTAMDTFFEVSERARAKGLDSWRRLPAEDIPVNWREYQEKPRPVSARIVEDKDEAAGPVGPADTSSHEKADYEESE
ncbi:uncharacterized protein KD926_006545 [Aspergillus affinis]|uniref:uncharacterized protein n=1 Tax=Aspergillus affinis TaxID=1070780 RepID=UPI0022FEF43F|nr:uncharacterized protein KD926_006545 [Aspergillus affinis]KAI9041647.1 hypothetical protein KD926_006545 [Aspergillus affinis]